MEVAILRVCASVLFEGDFGQAEVVIGYTYKCLFLPLPHVLFKVFLFFLPSFPPTMIPPFPSLQPLNVITFPTRVKGEES